MGHPLVSRPPRRGELYPCFRSPPCLHVYSRRHACARRRTGPTLSSDLDGSVRLNSQYVPPITLLSLDSSDPTALICAAGAPHCIQPLRLPTCGPNNPGGEHIALCSTPQGTTIQGCLSPHGSVATCRGVLCSADRFIKQLASHQTWRQDFFNVIEGMEEHSQ